MKGIKCRAWDKKREEMLYMITQRYLWEFFDMLRGRSRSLKGLLFLQFTEYKDKRGKDIYEGDICKLFPLREGEPICYTQILFRECGFEMYSLVGNMRYVRTIYDESKDKRIEVIGNIYQNPELLQDLVLIPNKHPSKLGNKIIKIDNDKVKSLVLNHHEKTNNPELKRLQKADRYAARLERKHMRPIQGFTTIGKEQISPSEIEEIKLNIEEKQDNLIELYNYIYSEKRLDNFTENQKYGGTSLRKHLLLTTQLILTQ